MANTRFHSHLIDKVREVIEARTKQMAAGTLTDWGHYKYESGYIQGMLDVLTLADDVEKEYE